MRFNCGPSTNEQKTQSRLDANELAIHLTRWHPVFLFWPRRMNNVIHECRFLEYVDRRYPEAEAMQDITGWYYVDKGYALYRPIE